MKISSIPIPTLALIRMIMFYFQTESMILGLLLEKTCSAVFNNNNGKIPGNEPFRCNVMPELVLLGTGEAASARRGINSREANWPLLIQR